MKINRIHAKQLLPFSYLPDLTYSVTVAKIPYRNSLEEECAMSSSKKSPPVVPRRNNEGNEIAEPVLAMPASGIDPDWRERIELAKRTYKEGKKLREGKPITLRRSRPMKLGDGYNG